MTFVLGAYTASRILSHGGHCLTAPLGKSILSPTLFPTLHSGIGVDGPQGMTFYNPMENSAC